MKAVLLLALVLVARAPGATGFAQLLSRPSFSSGVRTAHVRKWNMQMEGDKSDRMSRRALSTLLGASIIYSLSPDVAHAGITEIVTGTSKRKDTLARIKAGDVWLPRLSCFPPEPCMQQTTDKWYDFPPTVDGYTSTPSGLKVKPLPPLEEMKEVVTQAPFPTEAQGTSNIQIICAGYILGAATEQQIKDYLDPQSKSSKYY
ncbi:hypothetical protein GUITHDRAFT_150135, partial [Guillardia theta CCMP2712]